MGRLVERPAQLVEGLATSRPPFCDSFVAGNFADT